MRTYFFILILLFSHSVVAQQTAEKSKTPTNDQDETEVVCEVDSKLTDISYEDLRKKLEAVLSEKNKSLTFLDLRALQAQMDIMVGHLISESEMSKPNALVFLERTKEYYEQLGNLLDKTKENAKIIKENHVVPLAAVTSMKAEMDKCYGLQTQYADIFSILSKLNRDLNEILMMSPSRLNAQKEKVKNLLTQVKRLPEEQKINSSDLVENLNFMQMQINTVTQTFDFNSKIIQLATSTSPY
ncbi:MAG: hypothetical protein H6623_06565 [Bdellovibrionaceae bacterium]|nr:hypothetical protein [Pseudobdellovibrionaceae bacterium]